MPRRLRIAEKFASYRRDVIPNNAPPVQIEECRRAFFAGAVALYGLMMAGLSSAPGVTQDDMSFMADVDAELRAFPKSVTSR